jgi:hypothetical protein
LTEPICVQLWGRSHGHSIGFGPWNGWSTRRAKREAACGGHQLWAVAGTLFEQVILVDGSSHFAELTRHQTKRDTTVRKDGTRRHQLYARYTLPCPAGKAA